MNVLAELNPFASAPTVSSGTERPSQLEIAPIPSAAAFIPNQAFMDALYAQIVQGHPCDLDVRHK